MERLTITVVEAARMLGISRTTAYECVARGDIPSVRLGGRVLMPRARFFAILDEPVEGHVSNGEAAA